MDSIRNILIAFVASSGFWAFLSGVLKWKTNKNDEDAQHKQRVKEIYESKAEDELKANLMSKMLIGLAHDRIMTLGVIYIERGWITFDEYENLHNYLYEPYSNMGGNGSAAKVMSDVTKLPIKKGDYVHEVHK